jgi:hypothetical protein
MASQYEKIINHGFNTICETKRKNARNKSVPTSTTPNPKKTKTYGDQYMTSNHKRERDNQCPIPSWDLPLKWHSVRCEDNHHGDAREANHE